MNFKLERKAAGAALTKFNVTDVSGLTVSSQEES